MGKIGNQFILSHGFCPEPFLTVLELLFQKNGVICHIFILTWENLLVLLDEIPAHELFQFLSGLSLGAAANKHKCNDNACSPCNGHNSTARVNELLQGIPLQIIDVPLAAIEKGSIAHINEKTFVKPVEKLLIECNAQKEK